ncbi:MAG: 2-C-methyl-D-erythritol 4-phosphate cytidylyltransferase, partial [Proteobacteria bacterium]|nr:2-C-methyl-D-erythritol 4-phosphate cytidylyltransferase [Pseudomonadota bacterium]
MAEYDFFATLREELNQIEREADGPGVHDAVRPFVSEGTSARITSALARHKAVIPVMPIKE